RDRRDLERRKLRAGVGPLRDRLRRAFLHPAGGAARTLDEHLSVEGNRAKTRADLTDHRTLAQVFDEVREVRAAIEDEVARPSVVTRQRVRRANRSLLDLQRLDQVFVTRVDALSDLRRVDALAE